MVAQDLPDDNFMLGIYRMEVCLKSIRTCVIHYLADIQDTELKDQEKHSVSGVYHNSDIDLQFHNARNSIYRCVKFKYSYDLVGIDVKYIHRNKYIYPVFLQPEYLLPEAIRGLSL